MSNIQTTLRGSYVLSMKQEPTGANLVEFRYRDNQISVNHAPWRNVGKGEFISLLNHVLQTNGTITTTTSPL